MNTDMLFTKIELEYIKERVTIMQTMEPGIERSDKIWNISMPVISASGLHRHSFLVGVVNDILETGVSF